MALISLITVVIAWGTGKYFENEENKEFLLKLADDHDEIVYLSGGILAAVHTGKENRIISYYNLGEGNGYGGPIEMLLRSDTSGIVTEVILKDHSETPSYLKKVIRANYTGSFNGYTLEQISVTGSCPDAIAGATNTCNGINEAVREAGRALAVTVFNIPLPEERDTGFKFGFKEVLLLLLFVAGFIGRLKEIKYREFIRWISLLSGMIFLGFVFNSQVTISKIDSILLGYWPDWRIDIYWIILLGGIAGILLLSGKNPYCYWFCPFGAAQECLAVAGNASRKRIEKFSRQLKWVQRYLAWIAILIALVFRNPGLSGYEVFSGLFDLTATLPVFILLGITLITSLFVHRPWCNYLCPMDPLFSLINLFRNWIPELWKKKQKNQAFQ